jgi:micrococcal nuclease
MENKFLLFIPLFLIAITTFQLVKLNSFCKGNRNLCFATYVVKVIDGDTIETENGVIRLSLVNAPGKNEEGFEEAKEFVKSFCLNKKVFVDIDDLQVKDVYGRWVAKVYCNRINLNEKLVENGLAKINKDFCKKSEFSKESWTGCY